MKRTPMKQGKSARQAAYDNEFEAYKPLVRIRSKGICEAATFVLYHLLRTPETQIALDDFLDVGCGIYAVHIHHRKYRSRGGSNQITNLLDICLAHHEWIHAHGGFGESANLLGLALSAGELEML
jgi:hypothetical protein